MHGTCYYGAMLHGGYYFIFQGRVEQRLPDMVGPGEIKTQSGPKLTAPTETE